MAASGPQLYSAQLLASSFLPNPDSAFVAAAPTPFFLLSPPSSLPERGSGIHSSSEVQSILCWWGSPIVLGSRCAGVMFPCHGVTTANARPLGVPAVSRYGSPARLSFLARPAFLSMRSPAFHPDNKSLVALRDFHTHAISTSFVKYDSVKGIKPFLSVRSLNPRTQVTCQASLSSFSYPELESKPKWWWRTLACVPYLLPLHNMWSNADAIYQLHPYLQRFNLLYAFIDTMALLPGWLFLVIFMTIYFFVVRRKWSPHFLRFHIILAILLDTGSQALATACNWNPSIVFQGKPMAYFWMTMAFIQIFTVLECMRCALAGVYANIPFISHAAFIHSDLNLFR